MLILKKSTDDKGNMKITQYAKSRTSLIFFSAKLTPSSPLDSLYEIYYRETPSMLGNFCMVLLNSDVLLIFKTLSEHNTRSGSKQFAKQTAKVVKDKHCRPRIAFVFVTIKSFNSTCS